jgi:hypothetical protein
LLIIPKHILLQILSILLQPNLVVLNPVLVMAHAGRGQDGGKAGSHQAGENMKKVFDLTNIPSQSN